MNHCQMQEKYTHCNKGMTDIISKATSKDPKDRYDNCKSFISDLIDLKKENLSLKTGEQNDIKLEKVKTKKGQIRVELK